VLIVQVADNVAHLLGYGHMVGYPDSVKETYEGMGNLGIDQRTADKLIGKIKDFYLEQSAAFS